MADTTPAIETRGLNLWYGTFQALFDVDLQVPAGRITSLIGPSGCGKSTLLRAINRIIERLPYVRTTGRILVHGHDVYADGVEVVQVRRQVGMVFQRPNPLPLSVRDNILFGTRLHDPAGDRISRARADEIVVVLAGATGGRPHHRIGDRHRDLRELGHDLDNPAAV